jgi:hypothetical protein
MADGTVNKCKDCNLKDVKVNYYKKAEDIVFIEKERARGREKYERLNYKDRIDNRQTPWKDNPTYKGLHKKFKAEKETELHHWNYNNEFLEDIVFMDIRQHRQAHVGLILDKEKRIFKTIEGVYLETKEQHLEYLVSRQIKFLLN